jgi:hypothetical protein
LVIEGGDELKIAAVGGFEDRREFKQSVDVLFHGCGFVDGLSDPRLNFPIVLELRDVVGSGLSGLGY